MRRLTTTLLIIVIGGLVLWEVLAQGTKVWTKYKIIKEPLPSLTTLLPTSMIQPLIALTFISALVFITVSTALRARKLFGLIPLNELNRHVVVLGPTGSGKTTVAKAIIEKALRSKSVEQVIIIDWKGEYSQWVKGATIVRKLRNVWDIPGDNPREKALMATELIREMGRDVIDITPPSSLLLLKILEEEYRRGVPTTEKVLKMLEKCAEIAQREYRLAEANMYLALARRLYLLLVDEERSAENVEGNPQLLIYDLKDLPSVYLKNLYASFVIINVYRKAYASAGAGATLRSLLIAEETQNYIRHRRPEEPPTMSERLVYELRALGVGAVLICPDPELIPTPVLRDVGSIISLSPDTLPRFALERYLFRASLEEAEDTLKKLKKAKAIIVYRGQLHFLRRLPKPPKELRLRPKGDRMGVTDPGVGSFRAWPILPHRSPGRPTVEVKEEVKEKEEVKKPKVIEVITEPTTESKPKVLETVEELRLEPEEEVVEKEVTEEQVIEEKVTEEESGEPESVPKGPPIPCTLLYRGSLCPAGRPHRTPVH